MATATIRETAALAGIPVGRRTPRGRKRWYLAHTPAGREERICEQVLRVVPRDLLEDAFVMRKEVVKKIRGTWVTQVRALYPEYFVVVTGDVVALDRELRKLTLPVRIALSEDAHYAPLSEEACVWYEQMMDAAHVIRASRGEVVDGVLHVLSGPMVGRESEITKVNRCKSLCSVAIGDGWGSYTENVALEVPTKT